MQNKEILSYLKTISVIITSLVLFAFPLFVITNTTEFFVFPKQMLLIYATLFLMLLWGIRMYFEKKLVVRANPFTLAITLFAATLLVSSLFSKHIYDSLIQSIPVIFAIFFFFTTVNSVEEKSSFNMVLSSLVLGAVVSSVISILYYFKIYFLPFPNLQTQYFSTFGSSVQFLMYTIPVLLLSSSYLLKRQNLKQIGSNYNLLFQIGSSIVILVGISLVILEIITSPQKPLLLPYIHGFQIALAAISQDVGRLLTSFLFGSGYGTFSIDYSRFRLATINQDPTIWNVGFSASSSYVLELLATTGVLGIISFFFLTIKALRVRAKVVNPLHISLLVVVGMAFFLPFSFSLVFLLFSLLAVYTSFLYIEADKRVYNMTIRMVALQEGLLSFQEEGEAKSHGKNLATLPIAYLVTVIALAGFIGFYGYKLIISDINFAQSLSKESLSSGQKTYTLQQSAIADFPFRSDYYRVFAQVNLALANSLATQNTGKTITPEAQQQILQLLQQSINSGRVAVSYGPYSPANWENLSQIYRSLIGVGQNAQQFAVGSLQQAIAYDPSNPQLYVELGGVYYQLQSYDLAQNQFQLAAQLKPDYPNAYYNLGHTLEQKGDLQNALNAYLQVRELVKNNKNNLDQIDKEIATLREKIGNTQQAKTQTAPEVAGAKTSQNQEPLQVNKPNPTIPPQEKPIKISPPPITATPTEAPKPTPSGEATPTAAPTQ